MYLFIYKTTHKNGLYYIGRHQTKNKDDGYLGSGVWVSAIKDKTTLIREIIAEATSFEELCDLEEYHISLHFGKPGCMNMKLGSTGWSSEDVKARVENGTHNWVGGDFQSKQQRARVENGTHHFLGGEVARVAAKKQVEAGTHHFLGGEISRKNAARRIDEGTHNFQGDNNPSKQKAKDGTHHFQQPWTCPHCDKSGKGIGLFERWHGDNCKHR